MSASNSANNVSQAQNPISRTESNPHITKWLGRTVFSLDKCTWLLGALLIITGIVLFVLNTLYAADFYIAAVASISIGAAIFFLGLLFNCCKVGRCLSENNRTNPDISQLESLQNTSQTKTPQSQTEPFQPLAVETTVKTFFEEKGIFGVPQSLIDEIEVWRKFRLKGNLGITLEAGFILDGPPGTGKTTIAQAIAEILGGEYIEKKCGELKDSLHGNTEKNITNLFTVPENQFRVVVIDEITGLLPTRTGRHWDGCITDHFLSVVSGTTQIKPPYILIGTTNNFQDLDTALVRRGRLGKRFTINSPDYETRLKIFNYHLSKISRSSDQDWTKCIESLARKSNRQSGAGIVGIIADAQRKALLADRDLRIDDF